MATSFTRWQAFNGTPPPVKLCWERKNGLETAAQVRKFGSFVNGRKTIYPVKAGFVVINQENQVPCSVQGNGTGYDVNFLNGEPMLRAKDFPTQASGMNCPLTIAFSDPVSAAGLFVTLDGDDDIYDGRMIGATLYAEFSDNSVLKCDAAGAVERMIPGTDNNAVTAPFVGAASQPGGPGIRKLYIDANAMNAYFTALLTSALYWYA